LFYAIVRKNVKIISRSESFIHIAERLLIDYCCQLESRSSDCSYTSYQSVILLTTASALHKYSEWPLYVGLTSLPLGLSKSSYLRSLLSSWLPFITGRGPAYT